jgi:hypothetical protein
VHAPVDHRRDIVEQAGEIRACLAPGHAGSLP